MTQPEIIARSAELRLDRILEELRGPDDDPFAKYADPGPPRDVPLPGWKRSRWVKRMLRSLR